MSVDLTSSDWTFIEARLLRDSKYTDPGLRSKASRHIRWHVERLLKDLYPELLDTLESHISKEEQTRAIDSIISGLNKISRQIDRWNNLENLHWFFTQVEREVRLEMDNPVEYLNLGDEFALEELVKEQSQQLPGNFDDFRFLPGTLQALVTRYHRGANRAADRLKKANQGYSRPDSLMREIVATSLAILWEEIVGSPPRISNNSGYFRLINYFYEKLGLRERGVASLKCDLQTHFERYSGNIPTKFP